MAKFDGTMRVAMNVGMSLEGGSVMLQIGEDLTDMSLADMAMDLIESVEGRDGSIYQCDQSMLADVQRELDIVSHLIGNRLELERDRAQLRTGGGGADRALAHIANLTSEPLGEALA